MDVGTTTRSLSGLLAGTPSEYVKPFKVELIQDAGGELRARLLVDDATVGAQYRVSGRCSPSGVEVQLPPRWITQGLGVVRAWASLHFAVNSDGDLIGNLVYRAYGVILIVPVIATGNAWYRFTRDEPLPVDTPQR